MYCIQFEAQAPKHIYRAPLYNLTMLFSRFLLQSKESVCMTVLPLSLKASISRICVSQTCLTLINFIEKSINMYNIK